MDPITQFKGEYRFLSNFYYPAPVILDGELYLCVENAYQAAKTEQKGLRIPFQTCTPAQAKRKGRNISIRPNWDAQKEAFMAMLLYEKFTKHPELGNKLLTTGNRELIHGNWWGDRIWGVWEGRGKNRLGILLMELRARISESFVAGKPIG